jgi:hypothetical protein
VTNDPNWAEIVTAFAAAFGTLALVGVAIQIGQERKSRNAQITLDMSRRWDEDLVRNARHIVTNYYSTPQALYRALRQSRERKTPLYGELFPEANFYEDLGVLCVNGTIDHRIIRESYGDTIWKRWKRWEIMAIWQRETAPLNYEHFEALAIAMRDDAPTRFGRRVKVKKVLRELRKARAARSLRPCLASSVLPRWGPFGPY